MALRRRQHAIGNYIVDFCAPGRKLIIELDGSHHLEQEEYDNERTGQLESMGYRLLRFSNHDINRDVESVVREILFSLGLEGELTCELCHVRGLVSRDRLPIPGPRLVEAYGPAPCEVDRGWYDIIKSR